tara:strand:+ start:26 stop:682 length:657 start_codon:yes stop_codon:yes gene_type:complete
VILIFGAAGHAKVIIDLVEKEGSHEILGLIDSSKKKGDDLMGYKILGQESDLPDIMANHSIKGGVIAIGDNGLRKKVNDKILRVCPDFNFLSFVHPSASMGKSAEVGIGSVILAGVIVNSDCRIGNHCILNTNSSLDHDSVMNNFSSLAPNSTVGGNVKIGEVSSIALGANIIQNITIGKHALIGAGSVVVEDIKDFSVNYGVPSKFIRNRKKDEKYI